MLFAYVRWQQCCPSPAAVGWGGAEATQVGAEGTRGRREGAEGVMREPEKTASYRGEEGRPYTVREPPSTRVPEGRPAKGEAEQR